MGRSRYPDGLPGHSKCDDVPEDVGGRISAARQTTDHYEASVSSQQSRRSGEDGRHTGHDCTKGVTGGDNLQFLGGP